MEKFHLKEQALKEEKQILDQDRREVTKLYVEVEKEKAHNEALRKNQIETESALKEVKSLRNEVELLKRENLNIKREYTHLSAEN